MHFQFIKYLLAGSVVVAVNLSVLYTLTEFFHIYYLLSAIGAFLVSFGVSFVLQKYWTFNDTRNEGMHRQAAFYFLVQLCNVSLNTGLLYVFVTYLHIWYVASQAFISFLLAVVIFFVNRYMVFKPNPL